MRRYGYSYLELILVLGIIVMSFSIIVPQLTQFSNAWTLDTEAYKMKTKIRYVQQLAVTKQNPHQITWDILSGDYYSLYQYNGVSFSVIENLRMANNIKIDSTTFTSAGSNTVNFDPFGAPTEGGDIILRDTLGNTKTIRITATLGRVYVY